MNNINLINQAMNCPKDIFIEDNTSILKFEDGTFKLNKNYDKECAYYARIWEEAQLTKEVM